MNPGHSFAGWTTRANGWGVRYTAGSTFVMPPHDVTLHAWWIPTGEPLYTVSYEGNGSDGGDLPVDSNAYVFDDAVEIAEHGSLTRTGYTFVGWNTAADGSGAAYSPGPTTMPAADLILYAIWGNDNPVAQWDMIAPAELLDTSGFGNDLHVADGAPLFGLFAGRPGLQFTGITDRLTSGPSATIQTIYGGMSVSFWSYGVASGQGALVSLYTTSGDRVWAISHQLPDELNVLDNAGYVGSSAVNFGASFVGGQWNHIVAVFDTAVSQITIHVNNGAPVSLALNTALFGSASVLYIGNNPPLNSAGDAPVNATIAGVRLYNRPITAPEVSSLYNEPPVQ